MNIPEILEERAGAGTVKKVLLDRKIPKIGWMYVLGSVTLFLIVMQAITGIFLAMNYSASTDHAYDSIRYIMSQPSGSFIRGLHSWGSSALIVSVALHFLRVYFMGAYKYPREATWIVGLFLLIIVIGFGFTGYLLPWDQKAYWATVVGLKVSEQVPYLGESIASILRGGPAIGVVTLTRFFAFHTLLLPYLLGVGVIIHLFLVVWHGISAPPERIKKGDNNGN